MDTFGINDRDELTGATAAHSVSIYLPTHPASKEGQQAPIRLKNLLDEAEVALKARDLGTGESRRILSAGRHLLGNQHFWNDRITGMALFLASGSFRAWRLPISVESLASVGNRFYVRPLFPLIRQPVYYLLAGSQNCVRLFRGNRHELTEATVAGMPHRMSDVVEHHLGDGQRQSYAGADGRPRQGVMSSKEVPGATVVAAPLRYEDPRAVVWSAAETAPALPSDGRK